MSALQTKPFRWNVRYPRTAGSLDSKGRLLYDGHGYLKKVSTWSSGELLHPPGINLGFTGLSIFTCAQGTSPYTRLGRRVLLSEAQLRLRFSLNCLDEIFGAFQRYAAITFRVCVVYDKFPISGVHSDYTDVFLSTRTDGTAVSTLTSPIRQDREDRFLLLYDRTYDMQPGPYNDHGGGASSYYITETHLSIDETIDLHGLGTEFDADDGTTVARGGLYLYIRSDAGVLSTFTPTRSYVRLDTVECHVCYRDLDQ